MLSTAATLVAVGALALAGAGSASAHSAMVEGTAQCRPDGTVSVTWTVTNDYPLSVDVTQTSSTGGGSVTGLPVTIDAATSSANTTATVRQEGISQGTQTATLGVHAVWSDSFAGDGSGTVTLPQDCVPTTTTVAPVAPVVTASQACDVPGSVTIVKTEGVSYFFNGKPIAAGQHQGPLSGTVTATADQGFKLTGASSWPVSVAAAEPCDTKVTPVTPTVVQASKCDTEGSLTIPATAGVSYFLNGKPIAAGKHQGPLSGTVTATADQGFELTGASSWPVSVAAAKHCDTKVTPVTPTVVQASKCDTEGSLTIPATAGVSYFLNGKPVAAGQHQGPLSGTVTATADQGFKLTGASSWPVSVDAAVDCGAVVTTPGGGGETSDETAAPASATPARVGTSAPAAVDTSVPAELAFTGLSPQTWTYGVGGGLALLLFGGLLTLTAARLRR